MYLKLKTYFIGDCLQRLSSLHDQSRVTILFNIAITVVVMGAIATIVSILFGTYPVLIPAIGNIIFGLLTLYTIRIKQDFQLAAKIYMIILFCLIFGNLNFNAGTMHVGILLWVMLLNILVLYILGIRWGIGFLSASLLGYIYYIHFVFPITLEIIEDLPKATYYAVYYETLFAFFLLAYIIYTILKSSQDSDFLLKEKNEALIKQNNLISMRDEEKTIMLKEIHHRVKNNLQVITSLLRLQMAEIDSDNEKSTFKDSINRVLTMAKIHDKMYQSEELSKLNLEDYFEGLSTDLIDSYQTNYGIEVQLDIQVEKIGLKTIVPLALIYNELFANSLKHAFEQTDSPEISVSIVHYNETHFTFTYADNGIWVDRSKETSFGLELIQSLTDQLDGEMEFSKAPATQFTFTFRYLDL